MPCLVLTGHPCVGKTCFAEKLKERVLSKKYSNVIQHVEIVNEESVCVDQSKSDCYIDSNHEKATRGAIKARVDSILQANTLVIVDSLNYIKGFRYELFCITKAQHDLHGVIWILNSSTEIAKEWNEKREDGYSDQQMEELVLRYEPPDARNRWDRPLYRVDLTPESSKGSSTTKEAAQDALQRSVYNMHSLSDAIDQQEEEGSKPKRSAAASSFKRATKGSSSTFRRAKQPESGTPAAPVSETPPPDKEEIPPPTKSLEDRIDEILDSFLHDVEPLKEGVSTQQHDMSDPNVLHQLDRCTQQICQAVMTAQAQATTGPLVLNLKNGTTRSITMKRPTRTVSLAELKRLRQQYVRWIQQHPPDDVTEQGMASSFVDYLQDQIQ